MTTPNIKLPELAAAQDQPWVPENGAKNLIDALLPDTVVSDALTTPPASPAAGACYIVAAAATGAWAGWEDGIAAYIGGAWVQVTPQEGWNYWVVSDGRRSIFTSGAWVASSAAGGAYDFGIAYAGTPATSETMGRLSMPRAITCPADFVGSVGR